MRISKKLAASVISETIGEDVMEVVKHLHGKKDVSEFELAEKAGRDINSTRNMLYRLHNHNLVSFIKKKDYKKGWYVYYWTMNNKRILELKDILKKNRIKFLQRRLERESGELFYICCNKCTRLEFDRATEFEFKCPECSSILVEQDNTKTITYLKSELEKLEAEIRI